MGLYGYHRVKAGEADGYGPVWLSRIPDFVLKLPSRWHC